VGSEVDRELSRGKGVGFWYSNGALHPSFVSMVVRMRGREDVRAV
jgi:hypothetical protein